MGTHGSFTSEKIVLIHNTTKYLNLHYDELLKELMARGANVFVVAPIDEAAPSLEKLGAQCIDIELSRYGINPFVEARTLYRLYRVLVNLQPDIVFNFTIKPVIYGSIAARFSGKARVYSMITGLGHLFMQGSSKYALLRVLTRYLYRLALKHNRHVFFQNAEDRALFQAYGLVKEEQGVTLNGTGIDLEKFKPDQTEAATGTFILASRLLWSKGIQEYVEAARDLRQRYPDSDFQLLGGLDDNPSSVTRKDIDDWDNENVINYLGETTDVRPYLKKASVLVLPTKYREGLPRSILEAMALGKAVIATDVPGCRDAVEEGENGFLVRVGSVESLRNTMERFLTNPELAVRMGQASRRLAETKYSVKDVNERILSKM
ncbi:glycosyltransferase family 4 protein [Pseudomonadota bacterium]